MGRVERNSAIVIHIDQKTVGGVCSCVCALYTNKDIHTVAMTNNWFHDVSMHAIFRREQQEWTSIIQNKKRMGSAFFFLGRRKYVHWTHQMRNKQSNTTIAAAASAASVWIVFDLHRQCINHTFSTCAVSFASKSLINDPNLFCFYVRNFCHAPPKHWYSLFFAWRRQIEYNFHDIAFIYFLMVSQ